MDDLYFLLGIVDEELVEVELNGEFYAMTGAEAAWLALGFLEN